MGYCNGSCKNLDSKKKKCTLTGEKLTHMKVSGPVGYEVFEHIGFCKEDARKEVLQRAIERISRGIQNCDKNIKDSYCVEETKRAREELTLIFEILKEKENEHESK